MTPITISTIMNGLCRRDDTNLEFPVVCAIQIVVILSIMEEDGIEPPDRLDGLARQEPGGSINIFRPVHILQPSELLRAAFFLVQGDEVVGDGIDGESGEGVYL